MKKLDAFRELIAGFNSLNQEGADAAQLARAVYSRTRILLVLMTDNTPESVSQRENLMEMQRNVEEFVAGRLEEDNSDVSMTDFLAEVSLATDQDESDKSNDRVTLMTVHAAKGLEFRNVMIVGVEEELFPSAMSCDSLQAIEEERRLLYVAITRAMEFCMITYAANRFRNGQTVITRPSRFLADIDRKFLRPVQGTDYEDVDHGVDPLAHYRESYHSNNGLEESRRKAQARAAKLAAQVAKNSTSGGENEFVIHNADELWAGMKIFHGRFGTGTITDVQDSASGAKITVTFKNADTKVLLLRFARFKILS